MNREDVIRMAKEAGWSGLYITWAEPTGKPDWSPYKETLTVPVTIEQVERFAALRDAAMKERCAKVCEERGNRNRIAAGLPNGDRDEFYCADDIRALP